MISWLRTQIVAIVSRFRKRSTKRVVPARASTRTPERLGERTAFVTDGALSKLERIARDSANHSIEEMDVELEPTSASNRSILVRPDQPLQETRRQANEFEAPSRRIEPDSNVLDNQVDWDGTYAAIEKDCSQIIHSATADAGRVK
jgi:hypothetical protein